MKFIFIVLMLCMTANAEPVLMSTKPNLLYTNRLELVIEYSNAEQLKPFSVMSGSCIGNVKIRYDNKYWIDRLKLPPTVTSIKEIILISATGDYVELVAEYTEYGLRSMMFTDDSLMFFMESIKDTDYFILGVVKNYTILETVVFPLNNNGHTSFINDCSK